MADKQQQSQDEDQGKAEAPPDENLYEKAEKDFWDIVQTEKKKQPDPSQDFEKSDTGKTSPVAEEGEEKTNGAPESDTKKD